MPSLAAVNDMVTTRRTKDETAQQSERRANAELCQAQLIHFMPMFHATLLVTGYNLGLRIIDNLECCASNFACRSTGMTSGADKVSSPRHAN